MPNPAEHLFPGRSLGDEEASRLAERMAALATASRVKLMYALLGGELAVDQLAEKTGLTPNAVSQQLRPLRHLRMVVGRRDGRTVRYRLHDAHIADLLAAIRHQHEHADRGWAEPAPNAARGADVGA